MDIRFIGIDGPRWMLRAVYQGPAAVDPTVSPQLGRCLRGVVVNRGQEAMPVSEALPLRLPREVMEAARAQAAAQQKAAANTAAPGGAVPGNGMAPMDPNAARTDPRAVNGSAPAGGDGNTTDGRTADIRPTGTGLPGSAAGDSAPRRRPSPRPRRSE